VLQISVVHVTGWSPQTYISSIFGVHEELLYIRDLRCAHLLHYLFAKTSNDFWSAVFSSTCDVTSTDFWQQIVTWQIGGQERNY
jgi:hypothetical protein